MIIKKQYIHVLLDSPSVNCQGSLRWRSARQMWSLTPGRWSEPKIRRKRNQEGSSQWVRHSNIYWLPKYFYFNRLCSLTLPGIKKLTKSKSFFSLCGSVLTVFSVVSGLSFPVYKGVMKKGYKVPTPIQRKVNYCCSGNFSQAPFNRLIFNPPSCLCLPSDHPCDPGRQRHRCHGEDWQRQDGCLPGAHV